MPSAPNMVMAAFHDRYPQWELQSPNCDDLYIWKQLLSKNSVAVASQAIADSWNKSNFKQEATS